VNDKRCLGLQPACTLAPAAATRPVPPRSGPTWQASRHPSRRAAESTTRPPPKFPDLSPTGPPARCCQSKTTLRPSCPRVRPSPGSTSASRMRPASGEGRSGTARGRATDTIRGRTLNTRSGPDFFSDASAFIAECDLSVKWLPTSQG